MDLFSKIDELKGFKTLSKHEQLVDGIINAIDAKILKRGDQLPSINQMVSRLGYASKTIVKAYEELKGRGIVESKNFVGYFIASEATNSTLKVALLLYAFHSFQEVFYNAFRASLGPDIQLDMFFHHNNPTIFATIVDSIKQNYGICVVAPIDDASSFDVLKVIPSDKLLLVDRYIYENNPYSYIAQEFENSSYNALCELQSRIAKFEKFTLFFRKNSDFPVGVLKGYERFIRDAGIAGEIAEGYDPGTVEKKQCYLVINDHELWELIKDCREKKLLIGEDVGIISHNDSAVKEIICDGITSFSTDFRKMAVEAAAYVLNPKFVQKIIPTKLNIRNSL